VNILRRLRLTRLRALVMVAPALALPLVGTSASATSRDGSAPAASRTAFASPSTFTTTPVQWLNGQDGKCLWGAVVNSGATMVQCGPPNAFLWNVTDIGGGYYQIRDTVTNQCLEVGASMNSEGAPATLDYCSRGFGPQTWRLIAADPNSVHAFGYQLMNVNNFQCVEPNPATLTAFLWQCSDQLPMWWYPIQQRAQ